MAYPITKRIGYLLLKPFIKEITGLENIPKNKPFIIASNHESYIDPVLLSVIMFKTINKKVHYLALAKLFRSEIRKIVWKRWAGCIPVDINGSNELMFKEVVNNLKKGEIIGIFPEGPKKDSKIKKGKTGFIRIALDAKVPILPVGLKDSYKVLPIEKWIPRKYKRLIKVNIGKPIYLDYLKRHNKKDLRRITDKLMKRIVRLRNEI